MDFFEFFGLAQSFQVDAAALRQQYLKNSRQYHPDFHTLADEAAQARALELSTLNNEAFKTLSDEDKRMAYVLEINGLLQEGDQSAALPQSFLLEMMDINEALMELEFDQDAARLEATRGAVEAQMAQLRQDVRPALERWQPDAPDGAALLRQVRDFFFKRKYLLRVQENLSKFAPA
jgi:molecular chaperone HscB